MMVIFVHLQAERTLNYLQVAGVINESPVKIQIQQKRISSNLSNQVILVANKADLVRNRQVKAAGKLTFMLIYEKDDN